MSGQVAEMEDGPSTGDGNLCLSERGMERSLAVGEEVNTVTEHQLRPRVPGSGLEPLGFSRLHNMQLLESGVAGSWDCLLI